MVIFAAIQQQSAADHKLENATIYHLARTDVPSTAPDAQAPVTAIRLACAPSEQVPAEITKEIKCGEPASPDPKTSRSAVPPQQALTASMQATYALSEQGHDKVTATLGLRPRTPRYNSL